MEPIKDIINPLKDVDAVSPVNMYKILANDKTGYAPCTAEGVMEILDWMGTDLKGKCKVIGRSMIVGKPLGLLLLARDAGNILPQQDDRTGKGNKGRRRAYSSRRLCKSLWEPTL